MPAGRFFSFSLALFAPLLAIAFLSAAPQSDLPAGAGKDTVEKSCTGCHEIDTVIMTRRTKGGWQDVVDDMAARGANASPEELAAVVQYLSEFFGQIDVNAASAPELEKFLGITSKDAEAIVEYRKAHGAFKDLDQLKKTPGVDADALQKKRDWIAFHE